jgi:hypothetical protein
VRVVIFFYEKIHVQQKVTLFMGDCPFFFTKKRRFENSTAFWLSELEDARSTVWLRRWSLKGKITKPKCEIRSFIPLTQSDVCTKTSQARATAAESPFLRSSLALAIETMVMEMVSNRFY